MLLYELTEDGVQCHLLEDVVFTEHCDVLCVGAGTAGVYAADSAAREGVKVILLENGANIGGMHVCGCVMGYYYGSAGGSFEADDEGCKADADVFADNNRPEAKQVQLIRRLNNSGVKLLCRHTPVGIYFEDDRIVGLKVFDGSGYRHIGSKLVIDATSDGHLIRMCPIKKQYGRPLDGKTVPFTVIPQLVQDGVIRGINVDHGYVDQYNSSEFSKKTILAHANLSRVLNKGEFLNMALRTGVREGLSFEGEEMLRYSDIILDKQPQKVLFYAYADLDKHGRDMAMDEELFQNWWVICNLPTVTARIPVPMGSVVPKGIKGMVTAGRCMCCDSYSQSAVRMNRDMFRMGECVGIAAAMAVKENVAFQEIDYTGYLKKVRAYHCFDGDTSRKFGFDTCRKPIVYKPVTFDIEKCIQLLETDTPGEAIWASYVSKSPEKTKDKIYAMMCKTESKTTRYNCAIALGLMADKGIETDEGLETVCMVRSILREIIGNRDCYYFKDCRRSNQFRTATALCLLGRIGNIEDISLLEEIVFNDAEFENPIYHTLEPDYLYYDGHDRNFVYFDIFTHACMAMIKILKRHGQGTVSLHDRLEELFADEKIIRRVTDSKEDEPTYIEIADFQKYVLKITRE